MPGASSDARLAYPIAILGRSKRNSRKSPFYTPFLFFPVPVIASLFSAFTAGASDLPEAAEATVSASDDARPPVLRPSHHRELMAATDLKQADLALIFGSKGIVSEVVNGKRGISKANAKALGEFFNISPAAFI